MRRAVLGPRGPDADPPPRPRAEPRRFRRRIHLAVARRPALQEFAAPHQVAESLGQAHAPLGGLVVFKQRHEDPRTRQRGIVYVWAKRTLPRRRGFGGWPAAPASRAGSSSVGFAVLAKVGTSFRYRSFDTCPAPCRRSRSRSLDRGFRAPRAASRPARAAWHATRPRPPLGLATAHIARP